MRTISRIFTSILWAVPLAVFAQIPNPNQVNTILYNIALALRVIIGIVFTLAIIVFGYGIVKMIVSSGDPKKIQDAKGIITWGVVAMAVLASLYGIIVFLQTYFGVYGGSGVIAPPQILYP